jgi:hypothetical protein
VTTPPCASLSRPLCSAAAQSPDPNQRHAAALALTVVAEGCADALRRRLPQALGLLLGALRDGDEGVRSAAAFAIGQMAEYVQPEVLEHHAQVGARVGALRVCWLVCRGCGGGPRGWSFGEGELCGDAPLRPPTPAPPPPLPQTPAPQVVPALLELLNSGAPNPDMLERLIYALDAYVENMSPDAITPYMGPLMQLLGAVLASPAAASAHKEALSALTSVVAAAGKSFSPYAGGSPRRRVDGGAAGPAGLCPQLSAWQAAAALCPHYPGPSPPRLPLPPAPDPPRPALPPATVLPVLQHFMQQPGEAALPARCKAIVCAGMLAETLGPGDPVVGPAIPGIAEAVLAGFGAADSAELREYCHIAVASLAAALREGAAPYVPRAVAAAAASCEQPDGEVVRRGGGGNGDAGSEDIGSEDSEDAEGEGEDDDDSDYGGASYRVRTGVVDEKIAATAAVGALADAAPAAVAPHAAALANLLKLGAQHPHEEVRAAAHEALPKLVLAAHRAAGGSSASGSGGGGGAPAALAPEVRQLADGAVGLLLDPLETDPDKPSVTAALAGLAALLEALGGACVDAQQLQGVAAAAAAVLQGKAACQEEDGDDEPGDEDDDAGEEEEDLMSAAADLLPALAAAAGPAAYAPVFMAAHLPHLLARLRPQQPAGVRGIAAGALAEVFERLGALAADAAEPALPALIRELRSDVSWGVRGWGAVGAVGAGRRRHPAMAALQQPCGRPAGSEPACPLRPLLPPRTPSTGRTRRLPSAS